VSNEGSTLPALACPLPSEGGGQIVLAHGGGMRLTARLLEEVFYPAFGNAALAARHDGATFETATGRLAFTTDSYVVRPLFFPGGSIGELAVYGTVNDLAMCGARAVALSAGFILEEGLPIDTLKRVVAAMRDAAARAQVSIVTGDTKVVERGKGDGVYINTSGIGVIEGPAILPSRIEPGDVILVSGDLGAHGIAILAAREQLGVQTDLNSDAAPLWEPVEALLQAGLDVHCLRDLTRGGLASAANELASTRGLDIELDEASIPVRDEVSAACELLGFDPLYIACEGRFCAFLPEAQAEKALDILRACRVSAGAMRAGRVREEARFGVIIRSRYGSSRVLDLPSGEQLPRIC
jgi:hydrogenase expression/formation protein HypE